ncbi:IMPACT family protein [Aerolutibacter ruishenii]|uniref:Putative IMPACT (Imprinted ancient) family translation regulator n=1 Tax=Aerolutibacter ruishenii TaxID=686800 RepID=A0A562LWE6_9GAMM|nr:YigZ family protein [Lysobacter ruishenii]TWI11873.1 putative IMPACT (imprinted ancient) family translation regulator [Lysobacter ruishenii]
MSIDTLAAPASHLLEVKHSRFLAQAASVTTAEQALAFFAEVGDPTATHNCWAYRLGGLYRFNDDGEPAGTAGRPILSAIDGQGYDQVAVVVTRWFGGIKLGAGGLVRAYGSAAAECLRTAPRQPLVVLREATVAYAFEDTGAVHAALAHFGAEKLDEAFGPDGARLHLRLPAERLAPLKVQLRDATRDRVRMLDQDSE